MYYSTYSLDKNLNYFNANCRIFLFSLICYSCFTMSKSAVKKREYFNFKINNLYYNRTPYSFLVKKRRRNQFICKNVYHSYSFISNKRFIIIII